MLTSRRVAVALLGFGLLALDSVLFLSFQFAHLDWHPALAGHVAVSLAAVLLGLRGEGGERRAALLQFASWMAVLGPFGALIAMTLFLPKAASGTGTVLQQPAVPGGEADGAPSGLEVLYNEVLDGRLRLDRGHLVRPLFDIMIEGEKAEKLEALAVIAKRYVPAFAPPLKRALGDADASVRVLAATVMAQLHDAHTRRIGALQEAAQTAPTPGDWRILGAARLTYAASGLLEAERAQREAEEGNACLARADALASAEEAQPARDDEAADEAVAAARLAA